MEACSTGTTEELPQGSDHVREIFSNSHRRVGLVATRYSLSHRPTANTNCSSSSAFIEKGMQKFGTSRVGNS